MISAETAYLFRHALVRDAAYSLQLPGDRAKLHGLAVIMIEQALGGRPPAPTPLDAAEPPKLEPHPIDFVAAELAAHARTAAGQDNELGEDFACLRRLYLRRAADHANATYAHADAIRLWTELASTCRGTARVATLCSLSRQCLHAGSIRQAIATAEEALQLAPHPGLPRAMALTALASASLGTEHQERAGVAFTEAAELLRQCGAKARLCAAQVGEANWQQMHGSIQDAIRFYAVALVTARELGNAKFEAAILTNMGLAHHHAGNVSECLTLQQQALRAAEAAEDARTLASVHINLAGALHRLGQTNAAIEHYELALQAARATGSRTTEGAALSDLSVALHGSGQDERALRCQLNATEITRECGNLRGEGRALTNLGVVYANIGQTVEAEASFAAAEHALRKASDPAGIAFVLSERGLMLVKLHRTREAGPVLEESAQLARSAGDRRMEANALWLLAVAAAGCNNRGRGVTHWREAAAIWAELEAADEQQRATLQMHTLCDDFGVARLDDTAGGTA